MSPLLANHRRDDCRFRSSIPAKAQTLLAIIGFWRQFRAVKTLAGRHRGAQCGYVTKFGERDSLPESWPSREDERTRELRETRLRAAMTASQGLHRSKLAPEADYWPKESWALLGMLLRNRQFNPFCGWRQRGHEKLSGEHYRRGQNISKMI